MQVMTVVISSALLTVMGMGAALGATSATDSRQACRSDAIHLCPDAVAASDRKAIRACLAQHKEQLSEGCVNAIKAKRRGDISQPPATKNE